MVTIAVTSPVGSGVGSGVVISSEGMIVNNHVVAAAMGGTGTLTVTLADGKTLNASIVGQEPSDDIAALHVDATGLIPAVLGTNVIVHPEDWVMAIGSPLGLDNSVTVGVVSAVGRSLDIASQGSDPLQQQQATQSISGAIQTDAPINPGNSAARSWTPRDESLASPPPSPPPAAATSASSPAASASAAIPSQPRTPPRPGSSASKH